MNLLFVYKNEHQNIWITVAFLKGHTTFKHTAYIPFLTRVFAVNIMTSSYGSFFRGIGPLCGEFTGHRLIPLTKIQ